MGGRIWIFAAACVAGSTLVAVCAYPSPVILLDQWDDTPWLRLALRGEITLADLLQPHNEHLIVWPRLLFLVDLFVFRFSNRFLMWFNFCGLGATCLLFLSTLRFAHLSRRNTVFLVGLTVITLLSGVQYENIFTGFQVQFVLVYLAATAAVLCALYAAQEHGSRTASWAWLSAAIAWAAVATLTMANGVLVWPCLAALALGYRPRFGRTLVVLGVGVCAIALFAWVNVPARDSGIVATKSLLIVAERATFRAALYLASPFLVAEGVAGPVGAVGWALGLGAGVYHLVHWRELDAMRWFHLVILSFVAGTAVITSLGRLQYPAEFVFTSRYATPALMFWLSSATLILLPMDGRRGAGMCRSGAILICAGLLVPSHVLALRDLQRATREREQAALTLIVGVYDDDVDLALYHSPSKLRAILPFYRENHLNLFRPQWTHYMGKQFSTLYPDGDTQTCAGAIEHAEPVPHVTEGEAIIADTLNGIRVWGWALSDRTEEPPPLVVLVDRDGLVCGLARPGTSIGVAKAGVSGKVGRMGMLGPRVQDRVTHADVSPRPPLHYGPGTWFGYSLVELGRIQNAYAVWPREGRAQRLRAPAP